MLIELLREAKPVRFTARGGSMWPAVRDGALVEVVPCAAESLAPGELAAYAGEGTLVVHRVVAREGASLRLRGDAMNHDDVVANDRVLGRARVIEHPPLRLRLPSIRHGIATLRAARSWLRRLWART